jgi:hypothetical protein
MLGYIVEHALLIDVGASAGEVNRVGSTIYGTGMEADGLYLNIERVANRLNGVTGTVIIDAVEHLYLNVIAGRIVGMGYTHISEESSQGNQDYHHW